MRERAREARRFAWWEKRAAREGLARPVGTDFRAHQPASHDRTVLCAGRMHWAVVCRPRALRGAPAARRARARVGVMHAARRGGRREGCTHQAQAFFR